MIVPLVLMVVFFFVLGTFAAQNSGTHDVRLFNLVWSQVPDWLPAVLSAAVMFVLMLVYAGYARIRHTVGHLTLRRRIDSGVATIADLRAENDRLRRELGRRPAGEQERAPAATGIRGPAA
jgi:uncharacterized integral membrane protein